MIYCEGKNCLRKDKCAYHEEFKYEYPRQLLDLSRETSHAEGYPTFYSCGDKSKYYSTYRALGYRENEEYKNSLGFQYDEVCVNCEYRGICFCLLEFAGDITHSGKRIRLDCERIKANIEEDADYYKKWFKERGIEL